MRVRRERERENGMSHKSLPHRERAQQNSMLKWILGLVDSKRFPRMEFPKFDEWNSKPRHEVWQCRQPQELPEPFSLLRQCASGLRPFPSALVYQVTKHEISAGGNGFPPDVWKWWMTFICDTRGSHNQERWRSWRGQSLPHIAWNFATESEKWEKCRVNQAWWVLRRYHKIIYI